MFTTKGVKCTLLVLLCDGLGENGGTAGISIKSARLKKILHFRDYPQTIAVQNTKKCDSTFQQFKFIMNNKKKYLTC